MKKYGTYDVYQCVNCGEIRRIPKGTAETFPLEKLGMHPDCR